MADTYFYGFVFFLNRRDRRENGEKGHILQLTTCADVLRTATQATTRDKASSVHATIDILVVVVVVLTLKTIFYMCIFSES